jgi:hypothetical protein
VAPGLDEQRARWPVVDRRAQQTRAIRVVHPRRPLHFDVIAHLDDRQGLRPVLAGRKEPAPE